MTLQQVRMKQWVKQAENRLPCTHGMRVINQQLWCYCGDAGIVVFDSELQQQHTTPAAVMSEVFDGAEMSNGDVVIAACNGLYHSSNGKHFKLSYTYVCT